MPRYFFHVRDGTSFIDHQGTDLPDLTAARHEAVRFAAALLLDKAETFWKEGEWTVRVSNADDLTMFTLVFLATDAPAVAGR